MQITATTLLWLAAALGASAHPSAHAHAHLHNHRAAHAALAQRGHPVFWKPNHTKTSKTTPVPTPTSTPVAAPPPATAAPPPAKTTPTAAPAPTPTAPPFCGGRSKRATDAEIAYTGNIGVAGSWGCNIMTVDNSVAHLYQYTSVYNNVGSEAIAVTCFNKIGPQGGLTGFFGFSATSFVLAPGQTQTVAFDHNSQGACTHSPGSIPKTGWGEWAGTWVEFDFGNESNNKYSGADCSSLVAQSAGMDVPSCKVCVGSGNSNSACSTINTGGAGVNAYIKGTEAADGLGLNIAPGNVQLQVTVGF